MENIRLIRVKQRKKQAEIARAVGVSVTTYRRWERGEQEPTFTQIQRLASTFGVEHGKFFKFLEGNGIK